MALPAKHLLAEFMKAVYRLMTLAATEWCLFRIEA